MSYALYSKYQLYPCFIHLYLCTRVQCSWGGTLQGGGDNFSDTHELPRNGALYMQVLTTFLIFMSCLGMEPYIKVFKSLLHGVRGSDGSIHVYEGDTRMLCVSSCTIYMPLGLRVNTRKSYLSWNPGSKIVWSSSDTNFICNLIFSFKTEMHRGNYMMSTNLMSIYWLPIFLPFCLNIIICKLGSSCANKPKHLYLKQFK